MSIDEIKGKILRGAEFIERQQSQIEDLILNENVDDDTIRDAILDLKSLRENFHNKIDKISFEEWQEMLK